MKKFYNIQEVAKLLQVPTNKIRFYEKKGLITPQRNEENDYRLFVEEDIIKLQTILLYRELGLSVKDIGHLLAHTHKSSYLEHFYNQWQNINNQIHRLTQMRSALEDMMDQIYIHTDDDYTNELLASISQHVEKLNIQNGWKDQWDFNSWARKYDEDIKKDQDSLHIYTYYETLLQEVVNQTVTCITKENALLDIGVGTGNLSNRFDDLGYRIIGVDQSRAMLEVAKAKNPKLKVRLGEFLKLPFENNSFHGIVSTYAFHHLNDQEKQLALEEMFRVLVPDGVIVIGDLMFEDEMAKRSIYQDLTETERLVVEDEYYTLIDVLANWVKKYDKQVNKKQIDRFCWITTIK